MATSNFMRLPLSPSLHKVNSGRQCKPAPLVSKLAPYLNSVGQHRLQAASDMDAATLSEEQVLILTGIMQSSMPSMDLDAFQKVSCLQLADQHVVQWLYCREHGSCLAPYLAKVQLPSRDCCVLLRHTQLAQEAPHM